LPVRYLELSDACFLLGVLEYLLDVDGFLRALSAHVDRVVFSYNPAELAPDDRGSMGWLNALTTAQLTDALRRSGLQLEHLEPCGPSQVLGCARGRRSLLAQTMLPLRRARFLMSRAMSSGS
jgi:hypothetical protein